MTDAIQLGLNMHPRWLQGGAPEPFLMPLREIGLRVLEFHLDPTGSDWAEMASLVDACRALGFRASFHAPHKGPYNPAGFSGGDRPRIERLFEPALARAAAMAERAGATILVVHGAKGKSSRETLRRDTEAFLAWIRERAPNLQPALELRVREPDVVKIGDNKAELLAFTAQSAVPGLGICWDLGHDARNGSAPPPPGFVMNVTHVHVHDLSPSGEDHYPLLFGNAPYEDSLRRLREAGYEGACILEVDGRSVARMAQEEDVPYMDILRTSLHKMAEPFSPQRDH